MRKKLANILPILVIIGLLFLVDWALGWYGLRDYPRLSLFMISIQFLVHIKKALKRNNICWAIALFFSSLVGVIYSFGEMYARVGMIRMGGDISNDLKDGIYLSIVTWTTLGYGDLTPANSLRLFAGLQAFLGYVYMGILIAIIVKWLDIDEVSKEKRKSKPGIS